MLMHLYIYTRELKFSVENKTLFQEIKAHRNVVRKALVILHQRGMSFCEQNENARHDVYFSL